jgi:exosortase
VQSTSGPDGPVRRSPAWVYAVQIAALGALLILAYWPVLHRTIHKWQDDGNWSHGWLVPLFSLYFLYQNRGELSRARARTNWLGLAFLAFALLILLYFLFNTPMGYPRAFSFVLAIEAIALFLGGWQVFRIVWFPIAFLLFAIPLPDELYFQLTMPLRQLASTAAAWLLSVFVSDLYVAVSGVVIDYIYQGTKGQLNVEEACSGMRLMMAFVTLGVAMAYLGDRPLWQRAVMVLACVPIAVLCNVIRVTTTGFLHVYGRRDLADGSAHELLGLAMLPIALGLFVLLGYILDHLFVEVDDEEIETDRPSGEADTPRTTNGR